MIVKKMKKSILEDLLFKDTYVDESDDAEKLFDEINQSRNEQIERGIVKNKVFESIKSEEISKKIPKNWKWVRFNNIYNFIDYRGKTPKKINSGIRLIGSGNIKMGKLDFSSEDKYISKSEYSTRLSRGITKKGDILFITEGGSLGNVCLNTYDGECSCGQRVITFQQYKEGTLDNRYYMYLLMSEYFKIQLKEKSTGSAAVGIKSDKLKSFVFPLPPKNEQILIANKIDEVFKKLDEIQVIEEQLNILKSNFPGNMKKSIFEYAMSGKMFANDIKRWDKENSDNIYKHLWEVTAWDKRFKEVDNNHQKRIFKYKYYLASEMEKLKKEDGNVYLLSTGNFEGWTTEDMVDDYLAEGEVVAIPWGGAPNVKYYKGKFVTTDNRIATSLDTKVLLNKFLYYFMQSKLGYLDTIYRGTSLRHPSMKAVLDMEIPIPTIEEQEIIINKIEELLPLCDDIDNLVNE
jgi:restriction endonuclease S subunit